MSDQRYQIVFQGELVPGSQPEAVQQNLAKLFRMDEQKAGELLSGKRVVLKKEADQATAMKFRAAMKKAGAVCHMVSLDEPEEIEAAPPPQAPPEPPGTAGEQPGAGTGASTATDTGTSPGESQPVGDMELVGTIRTGGTDFSGPFDVAPAGTDIGEKRETGPEQDPDISHLSMAPPGEDLEEIPRDKPVEIPDLSHLSLEEPEGKSSE